MAYRIGIVGTGAGIRTHLLGMQALADVKPIGVVGSSIPRAASLLRENGMQESLACDWKALLNCEPDLICITVPPAMRNMYYSDLGDYKGALLIEKPFITYVSDGISIEKSLGHIFNNIYVNFQLRGLPALRFIREQILHGDLGVVYCMDSYERTGSFRTKVLPLWGRNQNTGGGQGFSMGSHLIDASLFLLGLTYSDVCSDSINGNLSSPNMEWNEANEENNVIDEYFQLNMRAGNVLIRVASSAISLGDRTVEFRIEGTKGTVEFQYQNGIGEYTIWTSEKGKQIRYINNRGETSCKLVDNLCPSLFRLAYPRYLENVLEDILNSTPKNNHVAKAVDGIENTRIIQKCFADL